MGDLKPFLILAALSRLSEFFKKRMNEVNRKSSKDMKEVGKQGIAYT